MNKIRICFIISDIDKALAFEWIASNLDTQKIEQFYILINPGDSILEDFLKSNGLTVLRTNFTSKLGFLGCILEIRAFLKKHKIGIVHTHLFRANLAGLLAARLSGIKKRIYTRHHSSFHHIYFPKSVWLDNLINRLATDIVAISKNVYNVLNEWEKVPTKKIHIIRHGFDLEQFQNVDAIRVEGLKRKYHYESKTPIIGVIARFTEWKGIQYIIPAYKRVLSEYPNACLVLANAHGDFQDELNAQLNQLPETSYQKIRFEEDLPALYQSFDIYVHTPIDEHSEAFGQTYVEALASGIPSVFSLSGISREYIEHEKNALVVPFNDSMAIFESIKRVLDKSYPKEWIEKGKEDVSARFGLKKFIESLENLYLIER